jgi:Spy/CpxP family protein refolding chaperone
MTIKNKAIVAVVLSAIISGLLPAFAQLEIPDTDVALDGDLVQTEDSNLVASLPPMPGGPGAVGRGMGRAGSPLAALQGELALTDEQYEKLFSIKKQFLNDAGPKMLALKSSERDLRDLLSQPSLDKQKVKDLQSRVNDQKAELANLKLDKKLSGLDVLTNEQRKEIRLQMLKGCMGAKEGGARKHHHRG